MNLTFEFKMPDEQLKPIIELLTETKKLRLELKRNRVEASK